MSQATERIRMPDTVTLSCPKCAASMRSYERNGVTIEQCVECRGVFLDRGELDHLIDAVNEPLPVAIGLVTTRLRQGRPRRQSRVGRPQTGADSSASFSNDRQRSTLCAPPCVLTRADTE